MDDRRRSQAVSAPAHDEPAAPAREPVDIKRDRVAEYGSGGSTPFTHATERQPGSRTPNCGFLQLVQGDCESPPAKRSNRNEGTRSLTANAVGICRQVGRGADGFSVWVVSDEFWLRVEPKLPRVERRLRYPGRKRLDDWAALQGILFVLYTGIAWRHLPLELGFGSGSTCYRRMVEWQQAGVWERLHAQLLAELQAAGEIE
jgi:transposase